MDLDEPKLKSSLGRHFECQEKVMLQMIDTIESLRVVGKNSLMVWQHSLIIATRSLIGPYHELKKHYDVESVLTTRFNQDSLEGLFSRLRFAAGNDATFGALCFKQLLRNHILGVSNYLPISRFANIRDDSIKKGSKEDIRWFSPKLSVEKVNELEGNSFILSSTE